jgi:hypothetical protein
MEQDEEMLLTIKRVINRTFMLRDGVWIEQGLSADTKADKTISYLSDAYFEFLRDNSGSGRILALGEALLFRWEGKTIKIEK